MNCFLLNKSILYIAYEPQLQKMVTIAIEPPAINILQMGHFTSIPAGQATEQISLYTNDLILQLHDTGPSLFLAIQTIEGNTWALTLSPWLLVKLGNILCL